MEKINIKDARIASALKTGMPELYDGVFIMFHRKSDNYPLLVRPSKWPSYQSNGEIADGVALIEGSKVLVIAPTDNALYWSSAPVNGGGTISTDRLVALVDWNGKTSTAIQTSKIECSVENYAPGFCNMYSRVNINGQGLTAGKWWLPSVGELNMVYANLIKVNYALSLINGATLLAELELWSSTEYNVIGAWFVNFAHGGISSFVKSEGKYRVRPVSTYMS